MLPARPLTLETYHRFFIDPWNTRIGVGQLNQILFMHGFVKLHHAKKVNIMERLVGQVDLLPPRRSTLHRAALSVASPPSAAVITAAQARDDVEAIGWAECPIGCVAMFAAPSADAPEPVGRVPRPADFVLAGRRPRSKRTRGSAYGPRGVAAASMKIKAGAPRKQAKVIVKEEEKEPEPELVSPPQPPPPPPLWMRSPTPPPPASPPPPQDVAPPPTPPPHQPQPTLAPIPAPPAWATPMVLPQPYPSQQLFWGLPLPSRPTAQPCPATPPPPGWSVPTPPPSFPASVWGAQMLPPVPPHVAWRWPPTTAPHPHWGNMLLPEHPPMQLQQSPPPLLLQQPPPHFQGQPLPGLVQTPPPPLLLQQPPPHLQGQPLQALPLPPPPPPPTLQHYPPRHFGGQHPPPALHQAVPPPMQLQPRPRLLSHWRRGCCRIGAFAGSVATSRASSDTTISTSLAAARLRRLRLPAVLNCCHARGTRNMERGLR